jgi:hypothetical protein
LTAGQSRFAPGRDGSEYDARDNSNPKPPDNRPEGKFLIFSASQSNETAMECLDEKSQPHGAFTVAFIKALNQQSVDASVMNLYSSTRAILKANGFRQEPVLGGQPGRQTETLFGLSKGSLVDRIQVPVLTIENNTVEIQGGFALQLLKDNELIHITEKDTLKLRVDSVIGINKSWAKVIRGNIKDITPGQLFEVSNWVSSKTPLLKLYIPKTSFSFSKISELAEINRKLRSNNGVPPSMKIKWVNDLDKTDPHASLFFKNDKCYMNIEGKGIRELKNPTLTTILNSCKKDSTLYFELPPMNDLAVALREQLEKNKNFELVSDPVNANYLLYGTLSENGKLAYGLRRAQTAARDTLESMPVQTGSFILADSSKNSIIAVTDGIYEYALKLAKIKGWIDLSGPVKGINRFPFHLEFKNTNSGTVIENFTCKIGDEIEPILKSNNSISGSEISERYIYVFGIDKNGTITLVYPGESDGNVHNKFPKEDFTGKITEYPLVKYEVADPAGTDKIFMLSTDEPITNYASIFNQSGTKSIITDSSSSLGYLLDLGNEKGTVKPKMINDRPDWSLIKVYIKSTH